MQTKEHTEGRAWEETEEEGRESLRDLVLRWRIQKWKCQRRSDRDRWRRRS
jgi:hypothetical protein